MLWYVRVDGLSPGQPVTLRVSANPAEFSKGQRLSRSWVQPEYAAISIDNLNWTQTPKSNNLAGGVVEYKFAAPAATIWLAWGPPFLPSHANALLNRITKRLPSAERFVLAKSRQGREVPALRIRSNSSDRERPAIWIQARQHAWEAGSSWVGLGFIEWVAGDDRLANLLRETTDIYFVPIMDVDNVTVGAGGKNAKPRDHNRDWSDTPHYPEVAAAQKQILDLDAQQGLSLFVDLHNPGRNDRAPYFYGPIDLSDLKDERQQTLRRLACRLQSRDRTADEAASHVPIRYVRQDARGTRSGQSWLGPKPHQRDHTYIGDSLEYQTKYRQGLPASGRPVGTGHRQLPEESVMRFTFPAFTRGPWEFLLVRPIVVGAATARTRSRWQWHRPDFVDQPRRFVRFALGCVSQRSLRSLLFDARPRRGQVRRLSIPVRGQLSQRVHKCQVDFQLRCLEPRIAAAMIFFR